MGQREVLTVHAFFRPVMNGLGHMALRIGGDFMFSFTILSGTSASL